MLSHKHKTETYFKDMFLIQKLKTLQDFRKFEKKGPLFLKTQTDHISQTDHIRAS